MSLSITIPYGGALHERVKNAVCSRKEFSDKKMKVFHKQWDDADDSMKAYIHERDVDKKRKDKKKFDGEVDYVTLEVPYVYATIMTAHTYYSSVILGRSPVWQFTARHGEGQDAVQAVEAVMDYQLKVGSQLPVMYNWLYDLSRYTLGIVGVYWEEEQKVVSKLVMEQPSIMGIPFGSPRQVMQEEIVPGYVGNKLFNIRPYDFFPDPRVPIWRFQEGEFCIRKTSESYFSLISDEHQTPGYYTNLKPLADHMKTRSNDRTQGSSRVELPVEPGDTGKAPGPGFVTITEAYIKLVPAVWGLGDSKRVETWCFTLAEDEVIISAKPLGLYHNKFPFQVMEGAFGSEEFAKFGMLEVIRPLTDILTWLVNSHFYNVRRVLNNQLVVDPSRVTMKDLTKPGQRIIRLKPQAYGSKTSDAIHQLQMSDVTRTHLADASYVEQMIQRVSAVVDNVMGMQDPGGRKTATEVRSSTGSSQVRLKTPIEYNSALALDPLSQMMLSNTQQLMSLDRKYSIAGNMMDTAQKFIDVNPQAIAGSFDFVSVDGTMPVDRLAQANFWKELLMQMSRNPQLMAEWDIGAMVAHTMKLQGERNVDRFRRINMNIMPPGVDLTAEVQKGNLIPIGGANGGRGGRAAAGATGTSGGTI